MRVLVTGGGGFLGRELANQLLEEGAEVVVLGRRHYPDLDPALIQVQADICDPQALAAACAGCCAVFHAAAVPGIWGRPSVFHAINVMGTENVIRACVENRVPNLIFTSSPSVVFSGGDMKNADETSPYPHRYLSEYARTKAEAEQRVLAANGQEGLSTVAIRPHLIWGVGDPHLVPRVLERARSGRLVQVGKGDNRVDLIHVKNAARAHVQAWQVLRQPGGRVAGRCYFVSDMKPVPLWEWISDLLQALGLTPVRRSIPLAAAYGLGAVLESVYSLLGSEKEPPMTRFLAQQLGTSHYFDISRAVEDFGYRPRVSPEAGFRELVQSLKKQQEG